MLKDNTGLPKQQKPPALRVRNQSNNIYDEPCKRDGLSHLQFKNKQESYSHSSIPMNIDIEYSFSPKLLIKSINTIIDNYESVNGDVDNSNEKSYTHREASRSNSISKANYTRENKDTNISKIFNSIFKNNYQECEFSLNKNELNSINSESFDDFTFKQDCKGDNSKIEISDGMSFRKDTRLELMYRGNNCLVLSPVRPATKLTNLRRGRNMNILLIF